MIKIQQLIVEALVTFILLSGFFPTTSLAQSNTFPEYELNVDEVTRLLNMELPDVINYIKARGIEIFRFRGENHEAPAQFPVFTHDIYDGFFESGAMAYETFGDGHRGNIQVDGTSIIAGKYYG